MKAAILEQLDKLVVREVPKPICGEHEIVVKIHACSVCGSDIRTYHYGNNRIQMPAIIGHEAAGEIVEVGAQVEKWKTGDRVAIGADMPCGTCYWCTNGMGTSCIHNYAVGYQFPGGFQEYLLLNETTLRLGPITLMPDAVSYQEAALAEPLGCAIHGLELSNFGFGKSICVIGLGPIGTMILELSRLFGASLVFAAQRSKKRLEMARNIFPDARFIATDDEDLVETVMEETDGEGVDLVITTSGTIEAQEAAVQIVRRRGFVNFFGGLKNQPKLCIDSNLIHYKECFLMGSHGSVPRHHRMAVDMISKRYVQAKKYISKIFPLDNIREAFQYHESRQGLKVIVEP